MPPLVAVALVLILCWGGLATLALVDARLRRRDDLHLARPPGGAVPGWASRALLAIGLGGALLRLPFALGRAARNIDESQYAAHVAFARHMGESLFATPAGLRGHVLLYRLGDLAQPYRVVDAITCAVYGLTAWLLGWTLLRALRRPGAACLAAGAYLAGALRFEGLSSNAEPYVNLCLALWLWVRCARDESRPASAGWRRDLAAGFALGLAAVMKEQALPYAALEGLWGLARWARGDLPGRRLPVAWARAAAGWALALAPWLGAFAAAGTLGPYLSFLFGWGRTLGAPVAGHEVQVSQTLLLDVAAGLLPLWTSPLALLGLAGALRGALEASQLGAPGRRFELACVLATGVTLACVSLGARWFDHYFLLVWVPLAGLAGLRLAALGGELRQGARGPRIAAGVLALSALILVPFELSRIPHQAGGGSLDAAGRERVAATARVVARASLPDQAVFVWGWREELYLAARRAPASRLRAQWALVASDELLAELQAAPPAVVVLAAGEDPDDDWSLERQPALVAWLLARYRPLPVPEQAYPVLVPRRGAQ